MFENVLKISKIMLTKETWYVIMHTVSEIVNHMNVSLKKYQKIIKKFLTIG
jgi:hypothetical protein